MDLRKVYDEKQARLSKIKSTPKKSSASAKNTPAKSKTAAAAGDSDNSLRGPGRPKKRILKSTRRKMGRPPKKIVAAAVEEPQPTPAAVEEKSPTPMDGLAAALKSSQGTGQSQLLRPPLLTQQPQQKSYVTNLSTISARFMKGKANPFANLMTKLAGPTPSETTPQATSNEKEDSSSSSSSSESEDEEEEEATAAAAARKGPKESSLSPSSSSSNSSDESDKNAEDSNYSPKSQKKAGSR